MEDFTREELQGIEQRAAGMANKDINPFWRRAYLNLADACDRIDAMTARTEDRNGMETIKDQEQKKTGVSGIAIEGGEELKI